MSEIYKNIPITKEAYDLLCETIDNSDASNVSEVLIGQHNLIQDVLLPQIAKLREALSWYADGDVGARARKALKR